MYSGGNDVFGSPWRELYRLDRLLAQLTKPAIAGAGEPPGVRGQLLELGVPLNRSFGREEMIVEVWGRKRPLLRQLHDFDDPMLPCA
jgi:hypothetical protein